MSYGLIPESLKYLLHKGDIHSGALMCNSNLCWRLVCFNFTKGIGGSILLLL